MKKVDMVLGDEKTTMEDPKSNVNESVEKNVSVADDAPKKVRPVVQTMAGTGAGILLGSVGTIVATAFTSPEKDEKPDKDDVINGGGGKNEVTPEWSDGEVEVPSSVNDEMSFSEAFAAARAEVGPGGAFEWRGNVYSTFTAEEWEAMSEEEKEEYFEHFSWGASSSSVDEPVPSAEPVSDPQTMDNPAKPEEPEAHVNETEDVNVINSTPEVEILGVAEDSETGFLYGGAVVGGHEVVFVDLDPVLGGAGEFDVMLVDADGDGVITEDEIIDVTDEHLDVASFEACAMGDSSMYAMDGGTVDYATESDADGYEFV